MEAESLAHDVVAQLRAAGHQAWLVGGCVRDLLLGISPKDFDIATDARPDRVVKLFPGSGQVGAHFGVVLVHNDDAHVEVATFRSDHEYVDGRRPGEVRFETDPREDVMRRDFTINGLMMDPESREVLDFVGGRADIEHRVIRAIGDPAARFREDHLRMLRAVRFAARLSFEIDEATLMAICGNCAAIHRVSAERIRDEIARILTEGGARRGFELLDASGLLRELLPEVAAMQGVQQPPEYHPEGDVWVHTLLLLEKLDHPSVSLAAAALLHDVGKPPTFRVADRIRFDGHAEVGAEMARDILTRLRFSRDQTDQVESLVANHMRFKDVGRMKESTLKRFLRMQDFDEHLELHRLDCLSGSGKLDNYYLAQQKLRAIPAEQLRPPRLIGGSDLIAAGYEPGPRFSEILAAVEEAQLEGSVATPDEAMELVRRQYPPS